jgi:EmrB/QacA subfamily drug resistance transporter
VIPLTGWASEHWGAKRVYMTSVALFGLGSALCGLAWSAESLIAFRVLQGFGGGMIMPVGMSLMAQVAGPHRIGRVMSVVGVPMLLGPIFGPVIGGLLVDNVSWRWIFFVNLPVVVLALVLAHRFLTADQGRADAGKLDLRGLALLSPGLAGVVFGLSESESHGGFTDPIVWVPILGGLALVAAFVLHALRAPRPLLDVRLFKERAYSAAAATTFLVAAALFGAMILLPLYYQVARGESALTAGLLMAPQGVGAAMAMPIAGRLTDKVGGGRVAVVGLIFATVGTLPFVMVGADSSYWLLGGILVIRGIGIGGTMMPAMAAAYATLTGPAIPRATSQLNVIQRIGGALGTALLAVTLQGEIEDAFPGGGGALQRVPDAARARVAEPLAGAFGNTFWWAVAMTVLALIPALILASAQRPPAPEAAEPVEQPEAAPVA